MDEFSNHLLLQMDLKSFMDSWSLFTDWSSSNIRSYSDIAEIIRCRVAALFSRRFPISMSIQYIIYLICRSVGNALVDINIYGDPNRRLIFLYWFCRPISIYNSLCPTVCIKFFNRTVHFCFRFCVNISMRILYPIIFFLSELDCSSPLKGVVALVLLLFDGF